MTDLQCAARRPETFSCDYVTCKGCNLCEQTTPQPELRSGIDTSPISTPKTKTHDDTPRSWADVVRNRPRWITDSSPTINPPIDLSQAFDAEIGDPIGSSPNSKNSGSSEHVIPDEPIRHDTPSPPTQPNASPDPSQRTVSNEEAPKTKTKKKRNRWTRDEMKDILSCYLESRRKNLPKIKGTYALWRDKNPLLHPNMTAVKLNTQLNYFMKNSVSSDELRQMEIDNNAEVTNEPEENNAPEENYD